MNIQWTRIAGIGLSAWNHGGAPVTVLMHHRPEEKKGAAHKPASLPTPEADPPEEVPKE
jgi:hypothetical protein